MLHWAPLRELTLLEESVSQRTFLGRFFTYSEWFSGRVDSRKDEYSLSSVLG